MIEQQKTIDLKTERCTGCASCANACPSRAITIIQDEKGFYVPEIGFDKCTNCGLCRKACPIGRKKELESTIEPEVYAAYAKDDNIRRHSSSGGIFSVLAKHILEQDGVVYGAAFDEKFKVVHIGVRTEKELERLRGSKYVQSFIRENLFIEIKKELEQNKAVLFSGTPCQVAGLKNFLHKDYDNLFLVDLICHGVPSPEVFAAYLKLLSQKYGGNISEYKFRDKHTSWKMGNIKFIVDSKQYRVYHALDYFTNLYSQSTIRNSCYQCAYASKGRISDLTIADYWKYTSTPDLPDDDKGHSCIICNTDKGNLLFKNVSQNLKFEKRTLEDAERGNPHLLFPREYQKNNFWKSFLEDDKIKAVKTFGAPSLRNFIITKLKIDFPLVYKFIMQIWRLIKK